MRRDQQMIITVQWTLAVVFICSGQLILSKMQQNCNTRLGLFWATKPGCISLGQISRWLSRRKIISGYWAHEPGFISLGHFTTLMHKTLMHQQRTQQAVGQNLPNASSASNRAVPCRSRSKMFWNHLTEHVEKSRSKIFLKIISEIVSNMVTRVKEN